MPIAKHVFDRLRDRLVGVVADPVGLIRSVEAVAAGKRDSAAIRIAVLPQNYGDISGDINYRASNGDEIWVVARDGRIVTVMLRRSGQPKTCDRFDTDAVVDFVSGTLILLDFVRS